MAKRIGFWTPNGRLPTYGGSVANDLRQILDRIDSDEQNEVFIIEFHEREIGVRSYPSWELFHEMMKDETEVKQ